MRQVNGFLSLFFWLILSHTAAFAQPIALGIGSTWTYRTPTGEHRTQTIVQIATIPVPGYETPLRTYIADDGEVWAWDGKGVIIGTLEGDQEASILEVAYVPILGTIGQHPNYYQFQAKQRVQVTAGTWDTARIYQNTADNSVIAWAPGVGILAEWIGGEETKSLVSHSPLLDVTLLLEPILIQKADSIGIAAVGGKGLPAIGGVENRRVSWGDCTGDNRPDCAILVQVGYAANNWKQWVMVWDAGRHYLGARLLASLDNGKAPAETLGISKEGIYASDGKYMKWWTVKGGKLSR